MTSKKELSERDICTKYISPAIEKAGWDMKACTTAKIENEECARGCAARHECVLGKEYRYPPEEIAYHSGQSHLALKAWRKTTNSSVNPK